METADVIEYPLLALNKLGLYSRTNSSKIVTIASLYSLPLVGILLIASTQYFLSDELNVYQFVSNLECLSAFGQHFGKIVTIAYNRKKFHRLIASRKLFVKLEVCEEILQIQLKRLLRTIINLQILFLVSMLTSVMLAVFSPLLGKTLPLGTWYVEGYDYLWTILLVLQTIVLPPIAIFLFAFDSMFLGFSIEVIVQFRILSNCFQTHNMCLNEDETDASNGFRKLVEHHAFLLRYLKDLKQVYSPANVVEYISIAPVICSEMYVLFESGNAATALRYGVIWFTSVFQLAFYCVPADYTISEATAVAESVYASTWYINKKSASWKSLPFVIQASQMQTSFKAGGLFDINTRSLLSVLKVSWSACTVMRALKKS